MTGDSPEKGSSKPAPLLFSCRLTLFIVLMLYCFATILQRISLGFALVCMVKRANGTTAESISDLDILKNVTEISSIAISDMKSLTVFGNSVNSSWDDDSLSENDVCRLKAVNRAANSSSALQQGEFEWSKEVQGQILGSFFYGYLFTQIFGGWLAERFGPKLALLWSIGSLSILTLLNPVAARQGSEYMFGVRLLMGLTHGAALPAVNVFAARWCAPQERAMLMGIAYGGFGFAAAFTFPIAAFLCKHVGWESIFYATGGFGVILGIVSFFLVYDWPEKHPRISARELECLRKHRSVSYSSSQTSKKAPTPWRQIITSVPINVVYLTHTCFTWGFLMVGMYMPTFMKEVLYMDTSQNGLYSSLPYMGMLSIHFAMGSLFDFFRRKNCCSLTMLRKIFNTVGMLGPALSMATSGFLSCSNMGLGIAVVTLGQTLAEFAFMGGYLLSIFNLAPQYAGVITGITNTFGVLPGFLCPLLVSLLTRNGTRGEWITAFLIAAGLNVLGAGLYAIFGTCELQPWARTKDRRGSSMINGAMEKVSSQNQNGANGNGPKDREMMPLSNEKNGDVSVQRFSYAPRHSIF